MDIEEMRWALNNAYPGTDWLADVACMNQLEVRNAYRRCLVSGRIKLKEKK